MKQTERKETGPSARGKYDETYKRHAVALTLEGGRTAESVAKELGVSTVTLYQWRRKYAPQPGLTGDRPQTLAAAEAEIDRLRAEVIRMRERETVLKKSLGILSETPTSGMPKLRP